MYDTLQQPARLTLVPFVPPTWKSATDEPRRKRMNTLPEDTLTTSFDFGVMGERDCEVTYEYEDERSDEGGIIRTVRNVTKVELCSHVHDVANLDLTTWFDFSDEVQCAVDEELTGKSYDELYSKEEGHYL